MTRTTVMGALATAAAVLVVAGCWGGDSDLGSGSAHGSSRRLVAASDVVGDAEAIGTCLRTDAGYEGFELLGAFTVSTAGFNAWLDTQIPTEWDATPEFTASRPGGEKLAACYLKGPFAVRRAPRIDGSSTTTTDIDDGQGLILIDAKGESATVSFGERPSSVVRPEMVAPTSTAGDPCPSCPKGPPPPDSLPG